MPQTDYDKQRKRVTPPQLSLASLRISQRRTQEEVRREVEVILGKSFTAGAMSAIESGTRGASAEVLAALETALRLRPGDLVTDYEPSHARRKVEDPAA